MIAALTNHLWQSTLFAGAAGLLTLLLRTNRAQPRYYLWLAASLKFLIPFSLLVNLGGELGRRSVPAQPLREVAFTVETITQQLAAPASSVPFAARASAGNLAPEILFALWACGFAIRDCAGSVGSALD
jgi:bla regulator protein blaR1